MEDYQRADHSCSLLNVLQTACGNQLGLQVVLELQSVYEQVFELGHNQLEVEGPESITKQAINIIIHTILTIHTKQDKQCFIINNTQMLA